MLHCWEERAAEDCNRAQLWRGVHAVLTSAMCVTMTSAQGNVSAEDHQLAPSHFTLSVNQNQITAH